jgi:hypothetical protein
MCLSLSNWGEESTPTSTQAERARVYSVEYDEQGRYDIRCGTEGLPALKGT